MIDLHLHSIYSDGTSTPKELVEQGVRLGLRAIALTDHDTVKGVDELASAAKEQRMDFIPGVELSAGTFSLRKDHQKEVHILGYFPRWDDKLKSALEPLRQVQSWREERNRSIVEKLRSYHVPVTYEELVELAGSNNVGRPHFAHWLIENGYAHTVSEAFQQFLTPGALTFTERKTFDIAGSIDLIRSAGGVAVLAHPKALHIFSDDDFENFLKGMVDKGLEGIEVYCSVHLPADIRRYERMAQKFNLIMTGGTYFHGKMKPDIRMGYGFGYTKVDDSVYDKLKAKLDSKKQ